MLVEVSGQSSSMTNHILRGFVRFSRLLRIWLEEGRNQSLIKPSVDLREAANFLVIALIGAATLYTASKDETILDHTLSQLQLYSGHLAIKPEAECTTLVGDPCLPGSSAAELEE
jgi:hypothetical protein